MNNIVFIDVETGGTDPNKHSTLEIALGAGWDGTKFDSWLHRHVREDPMTIDHNAIVNDHFNNVDNLGQSIADGANPCAIVQTIQTWVEATFPREVASKREPLILCGWNTGFDVNFLRRMYRLAEGDWMRVSRQYENGSVMELFRATFSYRCIDLFSVAQFLADHDCENWPERINSNEVFGHFNIYNEVDGKVPGGKPHTALYDMTAVAILYDRIGEYMATGFAK